MSILQPTNYTLVIDEGQRSLILAGLQLLAAKLPAQLDASVPGSEQEDKVFETHEEVVLLVDMLTELPQVEAGEPGIIHGLCY